MEDKLVMVSAVIGAIYIVARVVVLFTPTPRDDAALEKVGKWLILISKVTGLDLKKGIKKYQP